MTEIETAVLTADQNANDESVTNGNLTESEVSLKTLASNAEDTKKETSTEKAENPLNGHAVSSEDTNESKEDVEMKELKESENQSNPEKVDDEESKPEKSPDDKSAKEDKSPADEADKEMQSEKKEEEDSNENQEREEESHEDEKTSDDEKDNEETEPKDGEDVTQENIDDGDGKNESSEKQPSKKKKGKTSKPPGQKEEKEKPPAVTRSGRVSKRVSNFEMPITPSDKRAAEKTEYAFDGPGVKLGSIPCAQYWIAKTDSEDLKTLFKICFNRAGKNSEVKQQLRKYNGFNYPEESKDYQSRVNFIERLYKQAVYDFLKWLGIPHVKTQESLEELKMKLLDFLRCPKDHGLPGRSKAKVTPKKKGGSGTKKEKKKRSKKEGGNDSADSVVSDVDLSSDSSDDETAAKEKSTPPAGTKPSGTPSTSGKKRKADSESATPKAKKQKTDSAKKSETKSSPSSAKKKGPKPKGDGEPTNKELKKVLKEIIAKADLESITMKQVLTTVYEKYPDVNLSKRKAEIKDMVKSLLV